MMRKSMKFGIGMLVSSGLTYAHAATGYLSHTTGSISVAPREHLIIATTIVNWDTKASDQLAIQWIAPKNSFCANSEFKLIHGDRTVKDMSWAYRTVVHPAQNKTDIVCSGHWIANLINVTTHDVLATTGYHIPLK